MDFMRVRLICWKLKSGGIRQHAFERPRVSKYSTPALRRTSVEKSNFDRSVFARIINPYTSLSSKRIILRMQENLLPPLPIPPRTSPATTLPHTPLQPRHCPRNIDSHPRRSTDIHTHSPSAPALTHLAQHKRDVRSAVLCRPARSPRALI